MFKQLIPLVALAAAVGCAGTRATHTALSPSAVEPVEPAAAVTADNPDITPVAAEMPTADEPIGERLPDPAKTPAQSSAVGPTGRLELAAVEALAIASNPTLVQAHAQVEGTLGKALQAGLWPNPVLGYEGEKIGVDGTAGEFQGGFVRQEFVTAKKRRVSREKYLARAPGRRVRRPRPTAPHRQRRAPAILPLRGGRNGSSPSATRC